MATYTWEFGAEGSGLHFEIVYDIDAGTFTVTSMEGKFDLNALWWNDGVADGSSPTLAGKDNSLNMNGTGEDWDGVVKLSSAGLGKEGENKSTFISEGETAVFTLADFGIVGDFDPASGGTLGVRGTSVNGGDSFKLVDTTPEFDDGEEPEDHFPDFKEETGHSISHVTFYFQTEEGDVKPNPDGDGWFTVKFDDEANLSDDLDDWFDDALAYIASQNPDLDTSTLKGVSIKGGTEEVWYDIDNDPDDVDTPPDVWIVANKALDQDYEVINSDPFTVG